MKILACLAVARSSDLNEFNGVEVGRRASSHTEFLLLYSILSIPLYSKNGSDNAIYGIVKLSPLTNIS